VLDWHGRGDGVFGLASLLTSICAADIARVAREGQTCAIRGD
jgi:hypothetical protein